MSGSRVASRSGLSLRSLSDGDVGTNFRQKPPLFDSLRLKLKLLLLLMSETFSHRSERSVASAGKTHQKWADPSGGIYQGSAASLPSGITADVTSRHARLVCGQQEEGKKCDGLRSVTWGGGVWTRLQPLRNRESTDLHTDLVYTDSSVPVISLILVLIRVGIWCLSVCVISTSVQVCDLCRCLLFTTREI